RRARGNDAGVAMNGARVAAGRALAVAIVGLLLVIAAPLAARAQPTGGSAGGPWGGGAGGGALRPGGQGPEVRPDRATSETLLDTSPRGAARAVAGVALLVLLLITAAGFVDAVATGGRLRRALFWRLRRGSVVAISIALDAGARDEAQERLADLAGEHDLTDATARRRLLLGVCALLRGAEGSWRRAGAMAERPPSERAAEARFRELAARARGRYRDETIRREGATLRVAPAPAAASSALPPPAAGGAMVVTLLVASARRLPPPGEPRDARAIRGALARLERIGRAQLRAVEVVWSPSAAGEPFGE